MEQFLKLKNQESLSSQDSLRTLRQVSLIFLLLIGSTHIISGLMSSADMMIPISSLINRVLDIPFALMASIFGLSQARIDSQSKNAQKYYIFMGSVIIIIFLLMLYINIFLPDKI